jgi:hypothetical protein
MSLRQHTFAHTLNGNSEMKQKVMIEESPGLVVRILSSS